MPATPRDPAGPAAPCRRNGEPDRLRATTPSRPIRWAAAAAAPSATAQSCWSKASKAMSSRPTDAPGNIRGGGPGLGVSGSGDTLGRDRRRPARARRRPVTALLWAVWLHGEAGRRLVARRSDRSASSPAKSPARCPRCCRASPWWPFEFLAGQANDVEHIGRAGRAERDSGHDDDPLIGRARGRGEAPCAWPSRPSPRNYRRRGCGPDRRPTISAICRAIFCDLLIASVGTVGRSRAIRRAVEPELV